MTSSMRALALTLVASLAAAACAPASEVDEESSAAAGAIERVPGQRAGADFHPPSCPACVGVKAGRLWDYQGNKEFLAFGTNETLARVEGLPGHVTRPAVSVVRILAHGGNLHDLYDRNMDPAADWMGIWAGQLADRVAEAASRNVKVIVTFADYYKPLPGETILADNQGWCGVPTRPWPWYLKHAQKKYSFKPQDCPGEVNDAPNYEAIYKPFVQTVVRTLMARQQAGAFPAGTVLGYTLVNEFRALAPRGGTSTSHAALQGTEGFEIFARFTEDMIAAIRALDPNTLIMPGAISVAHVTDDHWPVKDAQLRKDADASAPTPWTAMRDGNTRWYRGLRRLLAIPMNAWNGSLYDFEPEIVPDLRAFRDHGVPFILSEFDFNGLDHHSGAPAPRQKPFPNGDEMRAHVCREMSDGPDGIGASVLLTWTKREMSNVWGASTIDGAWNDTWGPIGAAIHEGRRCM